MNFLSVGEAVQQGTELLKTAKVEAPRLTAQVLLCHAIHQERAYLFAHPEQSLTELQWIHYGRYLHQRLQGQPTQYITGVQEFYGRPFRVTPDVLIPRPETELLVETALHFCRGTVIDVGCGSGAIAVTLALESQARVTGTDISERAMTLARANAGSLHASVQFVLCDLLSGFGSATADVVVANPPYIRDDAKLQREVAEWEPRLALFAGADGLDVYRRLIPDAHRVLKPGGSLLLELGFDSLPGIQELLGSSWRNVAAHPDLAGIPRVLVCQRAE